MPVSGVNAGDTITEAWGNSVAAAITALEAVTPYVPGGTDVPIADGGTGASTAAAARTNLGVGTAQSPAFAGVAVPAVVFPATAVPVADPNTLDDYEEGTWTPGLAFGTPGTSVFTPTVAASGTYQKIGNRVHIGFRWQGTLAKGTASGNLNLTGLPFTAKTNADAPWTLAGYLGGWTKTGYTQVSPQVNSGAATALFALTGSGMAASNIAAADMVDGTVSAKFSGSYEV